jgi:hypothetical protein
MNPINNLCELLVPWIFPLIVSLFAKEMPYIYLIAYSQLINYIALFDVIT